MMKTEKDIPELRFPEFEGEWEGVQFGKRIQRVSEKYNPESDPQEFPCIELESISQDSGTVLQTFNSLELKSIKNKFQKGDILFGKLRPYLKKYYRAAYDGVCSSEIWVLKGKNTRNDFIYYLIQTEKFNNEVNLTIGSKMPRAEWSYISEIEFNFPTLPEQQKIASFLSAADQRIQLLTQKKEKLEQYKKGIMQQIFSQQLRFKDENGKDYPEWEEKWLGETTKIFDGTHQTPNYVDDGIPFYSVENVTADQFQITKYIAPKIYEDEIKRVKLEKGDILMTRIGSIGDVKYINWDVKASFYVSLALIKKNDHFLGEYLAFYLASIKFKKELWQRTIHVAFPKKINLGEIGNCSVKLPCIEEQQKIASFLSNLDEKISQVNKQIELTRKWKQGLLQKMFV